MTNLTQIPDTFPAGGEKRHAPFEDVQSDIMFIGDRALPADTDSAEDDRLENIIAECGSTGNPGFISVWKIVNRQMEYVTRIENETFLSQNGLEMLAKNYGAGTYELKIYTGGGKLFKKPRVVISEAAAQRVAPASAGGNDAVLQIARAMQEGFGKLGELILAVNKPAGGDRKEFLQEMLTMKQLFGGDGGGNGKQDSMDRLKETLQIANMLNGRGKNSDDEGGSNGTDLLLKMIDSFGPALAGAFTAKNGGEPPVSLPAPGSPPSPVAPAGAVVTQQTLTPQQRGEQQMQLLFRQSLANLCAQAKDDLDPGPFGAIVVMRAPKAVLNNLVGNPDWFAELCRIYPGCSSYPQWFAELREAVIEELKEDDNLTAGGDGGTNARTNTGSANVSFSDSDHDGGE